MSDSLDGKTPSACSPYNSALPTFPITPSPLKDKESSDMNLSNTTIAISPIGDQNDLTNLKVAKLSESETSESETQKKKKKKRFVRVSWNQATGNIEGSLRENGTKSYVLHETKATRIPIKLLKPRVLPNDDGIREVRDFMKELQTLRKGRRKKASTFGTSSSKSKLVSLPQKQDGAERSQNEYSDESIAQVERTMLSRKEEILTKLLSFTDEHVQDVVQSLKTKYYDNGETTDNGWLNELSNNDVLLSLLEEIVDKKEKEIKVLHSSDCSPLLLQNKLAFDNGTKIVMDTGVDGHQKMVLSMVVNKPGRYQLTIDGLDELSRLPYNEHDDIEDSELETNMFEDNAQTHVRKLGEVIYLKFIL